MNAQTKKSRFWFWFVITPLIIVVIAGIATIFIAFKYSDDVVAYTHSVTFSSRVNI
jgi:hypothetical protein